MDVLTHVLVPSLVLLAVGVAWRRVAAVTPLMVLADVDAFVGVHRALLHNVALVALAGVAAFAVARARGAADAPSWGVLAAFAWGSHLVLDLPTGIAALWPFTAAAAFVSVQVFWDAAAHAVLPVIEVGWAPHAPQAGDGTHFVTPATEWRVRAVSNWAVMTAGVLLPAAWACFAPGAAAWRARAVTRARAAWPARTEVDA